MISLRFLLRCVCITLLLGVFLFSCKSARPSKSSSRYRKVPVRTARATRTSRPPAKASTASSEKVETVIETARSYLGTPYRYGGTTRQGMDCSGLLITSFKAANLSIPRASYEQAEIGRSVRVSDIQPGDLVFFSERKGGRKVSHVGLVTEVKGSDEIIFIHSTNSRGVMEDDLFSEHYQKIFIKATRPF